MSMVEMPPAGGLGRPVMVPAAVLDDATGAEIAASLAPSGSSEAMTADTPMLVTVESERFARAWMDLTDIEHITLTAIMPDKRDIPTHTRTFTPSVLDTMAGWISDYQAEGMNVYFQVNAAHPACNKKPGKKEILHVDCRHADIDPDDEHYEYAKERERLHMLAELLQSDPTMPPTILIDSGNGIYPIWVTTKRIMAPAFIEGIEEENKQIEAAVGAAGTHNIDRLLRLPGTLNFPNKVKRDRGRGTTRARLIHCGTRTYTQAEAALLGTHWKLSIGNSALVRKPKAGATGGNGATSSAGAKRGMFGNDISRSAAAFRMGCRFRRSGKTFDEMCAALAEDPVTAEWTKEKGEPNDKRELRRIWDKAGALDAEINAVVEEFNTKYMVVNESGKALVYAPSYDPVLKRRHYDRISFDDFRRLYLNQIIQAGVDEKGCPILKSAATVWLSSPHRKQFINGVAFDPSGNTPEPGVLNLWHGFAVTPEPGDWSLLRQHIGRVLCGGNRPLFHYVMGWMARLVQHPAEQGEVAIVMKGAEGTGKGTLARALLRIFGQHGLAISNAKHLTGNFNGHLRDVVLLFADEAFYAGDRQHTGVVKSIITEPYLTVEAKFANAMQQPNFLHLMMASNEEWVVPAALEARRFCVLEAGNEVMGNHEYFAAIWKQMDCGGYEAMLHDLLHLDLTTFNVRNVPQTAGLEYQRKLSLPIPEAWWRDCLERGYVFKSKLGLEDVFAEWHEVVATELLFASYSEFAERHRERHPLTRESLGRFLRKMKATPSRPRNAVVGEHLTDEQTRAAPCAGSQSRSGRHTPTVTPSVLWGVPGRHS